MTSDPIPQQFILPIQQLVHELVNANFDNLEEDGRSGRLSAHDLRRVIEEYPNKLVNLPNDAFASKYASAFQVNGISNWRFDVSLWTEEEGRSDLTLQIEGCIDTGDIILKIDDLHVL